MTPNGSTFRTIRLAIDGLICVLLAPRCAACRDPVEHPTRSAVCERCWNAVVPTTPLGCCSFPPHVALATAIGPYEDSLKDIIHALKYEQRRSIARGLALRMRDAGHGVLDGADLVIPVPLHRARERERGFNQAREFPRHLGLRMADVLVRTRETTAQADLPATKRDANVRGAFALAAGTSVDGLIVVLVDDVSTTGATLNACAEPLLAGGAKEVRALTAARAYLRGSGATTTARRRP